MSVINCDRCGSDVIDTDFEDNYALVNDKVILGSCIEEVLTPQEFIEWENGKNEFKREPEDELTIKYEVEGICDDCGDEIEECHYFNKEGQRVHVTTVTQGHYYIDGSTSCEACHDDNR